LCLMNDLGAHLEFLRKNLDKLMPVKKNNKYYNKF
jgi:hypothetical protein